jgi:hypothetical protein
VLVSPNGQVGHVLWMGCYDLLVHEHPLREGVRDKTNHYVTGRDGGRGIVLRQGAQTPHRSPIVRQRRCD